MQNTAVEFNTMPKEAFQMGFRKWKERWAKCVEEQGSYFEIDKGPNLVM